MAKKSQLKDIAPRFGIGEWFGNNLTLLSSAERQQYAAEVMLLFTACDPDEQSMKYKKW